MSKNMRNKMLITVLILVIITLAGILIYQSLKSPETAVITETDEELTANETGQIRIVINPTITIKSSTMQDINFSNYNEDRNLVCKLVVDDKCVYESQSVNPGQIITADVIDDSELPSGKTQAIAEIYSYNDDGDMMGHTNVGVVLNKE